MKKLLTALPALALALLLMAGCSSADNAETTADTKTNARDADQAHKTQMASETRQASNESPRDFTIQTLDGKEFSLKDHRGEVVLVNFWATWCPPCRKEIPSFIEMHDELKDDGLTIIGVSMDKEGASKVNEYTQEMPINYPLAMGNDGALWSEYQAMLEPSQRGGIPYTVIFGPDGTVQHKIVGYRDKAGWLEMVQPLLKQVKS